MEKFVDNLPDRGILQLSMVGREITLQVNSEDLEEVKDKLKKLGVGNLNILEWRKCGMTLQGSGSGSDDKELVKISLIPASIDEGLRPIAFLSRFPLEEGPVEVMRDTIEDVLDSAGVTDAIYTIQVNKKAVSEKYFEAVKVAALNALFECGGVISIE